MKIGLVGLAALYWPVSLGDGFQLEEKVSFLAAATVGESEETILRTLGMSPSEYAEKFHVKLYDEPERMIEAEALDTVVILTPHSQHAKWVERLAKFGVSMYIPKTFATTLEDACSIVGIGKRDDLRIAVGPSARYLPSIRTVKQALDQGIIGEPFAIRVCHHHGTIDGFHPQDWYRDLKEGGPELSLAWYGIDVILSLMGNQVTRVYAEYGNFTTPDSPFMDCGRIGMRLDNGAIANFDMYFCNRNPYPSWQLEVIGPKGVISLHRVEGDTERMMVTVDSAEGSRTLPVPGDSPNWLMAWLSDWLEGREHAVTAEYALLVTEISLAARESAAGGRVITL